MQRRKRSGFALVVLTAAFCALPCWGHPTSPRDPHEPSHARIVSITFAQGTVLIHRAGSPNWSSVASNTPLEEGASIATSKRSFAEVEFEDGSLVRMGELSRLDFSQLVIIPRSHRQSRMRLVFGCVTMSAVPQRGETYALDAGGMLVSPQGKATVRADFAPGRLRLEVFRGHVRVAGSDISERLVKNQTFIYSRAGAHPAEKSDEIQRDDWDAWVDSRDRQARWAAYNEEEAAGGLMHGWSQELFPFEGLGTSSVQGDRDSQK